MKEKKNKKKKEIKKPLTITVKNPPTKEHVEELYKGYTKFLQEVYYS